MIAIDLETTWLEPWIDQIIEIAMVEFDEKNGKILREFSELINPWIDIPEMITHLTWITQQDVKGKELWNHTQMVIENFIGDSVILGHNVNFDISFLQAQGIDLSKNIYLDTFELANFVLLDEKSLSLETLCNSLWIELTWAHRALHDVHATIQLFQEIIKILKKLPTQKLQMIDYIANRSEKQTYHYLYTEVLKKKSRVFTEDAFLKNLLKILSKKEKKLSLFHDMDFDESVLTNFIQNSDVLEVRENQRSMIDAVGKNFKNNWKMVIEAPTGVWKTFAYLLPSIIHSIKTWEQIYVSTSTKALQDQIFYKDLHFLSENINIPFTFSKLKGKRNYIWIASFLKFIAFERILTQMESTFVLKILFWLYSTKSWELDELDYFWKEYSYIKEINADDFFTFSKDNIYAKYEFALRARRDAKNTNLVVINNSILFQDISWENSILWKVENLILDEAHTLEDIVTQALKVSCNYKDIDNHLKNIYSVLQKNKKVDVLSWSMSQRILFDIWVIFDNLHWYLNSKVMQDDQYKNILIQSDFYKLYLWDDESKQFYSEVQIQIIDMLDTLGDLDNETYMLLGREISFFEQVLKVLKVFWEKKNDSTYIKTISFTHMSQELQFWYTQLNVWNYLSTQLWDKLESCVLTSATLKIWESFDYIKKILSLNDFTEMTLQSDFDYSKQALLFMPTDIWSIKNNMQQVNMFMLEVITAVRWNVLALFTAFNSIQSVCSYVLPESKKQNINIYAQSIGWWKHKLIELFKKNADNSILIWTDTFWEWIDIPWDTLKYLIIHKVPFLVPNEPIFQARSQLFKNSFAEYSLPKAILKLKQWFGRLIRNKDDKGIVILLDDRIHTTNWWEALYDAFPEKINVKKWSSSDFIQILLDKNKT